MINKNKTLSINIYKPVCCRVAEYDVTAELPPSLYTHLVPAKGSKPLVKAPLLVTVHLLFTLSESGASDVPAVNMIVYYAGCHLLSINLYNLKLGCAY